MRLYKNGQGNPACEAVNPVCEAVNPACEATNFSNLFLGANIIIPGVNRIVKGKPLPQFYQFYLLYFCNINC